MAFYGREFVLASQENFETFLNAFGADAPDTFKSALLSQKPTLKLVRNGDSYTLYTSQVDGSIKELTFRSGVEFPETLQGRPCKTTITMDGNVMTQVQRFDNGVTFNIRREFSDNQVVATITMSNWDGTAKRIYKA